MTPSQSLWDMPLAEFREAVALRSSPGCGAAAAASADFGLALIMKGLKISEAKVPDERRVRLFENAEALLARLADCADRDMQAFGAYIEAVKLPSDGEHGRRLRRQALDKATVEVNRIPLATAGACLDGLDLAVSALPLTEPYLQSDVVAGGLLLHSGLSAVLLNVDANLASLDDARAQEQACNSRHSLQREADQKIQWLRERMGVSER